VLHSRLARGLDEAPGLLGMVHPIPLARRERHEERAGLLSPVLYENISLDRGESSVCLGKVVKELPERVGSDGHIAIKQDRPGGGGDERRTRWPG